MTDIRLNRLSSIFLDGIPVDLASHLLPFRSKLKPSLLLHIYAHASSQKKYSQKKLSDRDLNNFSRKAFLGLLDNLEGLIKGSTWHSRSTEWSDYYEEDNNNYNDRSLKQKAELVKEFIRSIKPKIVWDMGANTGFFSRIAGKDRALVISFDNDYGALEKNYLEMVKNQDKNILPLFADLTNPTPSLGWANKERLSLFERGPADVILALALIHHLAISQNIPLPFIASIFSQVSKYIIIEFIPKEDSQTHKLLMNRKDIFPDYTQAGFEKAFKEFYNIKKVCSLNQSKRILYLMERK